MKYRFELTGVTPILLHADDVEQADMLSAYRKAPGSKKDGKAGDDRSPPWTWMTYLYVEDGKVVIPSANISACMMDAGTAITLKAKTTFKQLTQTGLFYNSNSFPLLLNGKEVSADSIAAIKDLDFSEQQEKCREMGFELFVKRAKIPGGNSKHVRVRPKFTNWSLVGEVEVIASEITEEILKTLFEVAGTYKGLCDWRPGSKSRPGRFGIFTTELKRIGK